MRAARVLAAAVLTAALAVGWTAAPGAAPAVLAATPNLTLVSDATYLVLPDERKVAVTVNLTAANRMKDSATRRFYFRTAFLSVLPGTSNFRISGGAGKPRVSVSSRSASATVLRIDLGANLAAGRSTALSLAFDLADPGGAPDRPVRVSSSLVLFTAWAFATPETPGSTVTVSMPAGYNVTVGRGPLRGPTTTAGRETWTSGRLAAPLDFVADVSADNPATWAETTVPVAMEDGRTSLLVRSWPDDAAWRDRMIGLVGRALPLLEREIGLPWSPDEPLTIQETLARSTGGFAGVYDPAEHRLDIAYNASDLVVLHELAHAWFNGNLVGDRWAAEAFASYYADRVAAALGMQAPPAGEVDRQAPDAIPLNAWTAPDAEAASADGYAAAAAAHLAELVAQRAGTDALPKVWAMARDRIGAYQPDPGGDESLGAPPDWRGLLDLLEAATGKSFDDLWKTWVARPDDLDVIHARAAARERYDAVVERAGAWTLPRPVRDALRAWRFDVATASLDAADQVLTQRDRLEADAGAAGLALPPDLRAAFEADTGLANAAAQAQAEQATLDAIQRAASAKGPDEGAVADLVSAVGRFPSEPDRRLADARAAFSTGDLQAAVTAAADAETAWRDAFAIGRGRIVSAGLLVLALVLLLGLVRGHRRAAAPASEQEARRAT